MAVVRSSDEMNDNNNIYLWNISKINKNTNLHEKIIWLDKIEA